MMRKFNSAIGVKEFTTKQSIKLTEKSISQKNNANRFFTNLSEVFLFIVNIFKETFSRDFEFREFFNQCFQMGLKSLPLVSITGAIMGLVLTIQSRPVLVDFGAWNGYNFLD